MITALFAVSVLLILPLRKVRTHYRSQGKEEALVYHFVDNALLFFQPLAVVLLVYHALLAFVTAGSKFASTEFLVRLETGFINAKEFLGPFQDPWNVLRVLEILFFLGLFGLPFVSSPNLFTWMRRAKRNIRWMYTTAVLLCSFTLLGSELGEPAVTLQIQIRTNRAGYGALRQTVEAALSQQVGQDIYDKIRDTLPPVYGAALGSAKGRDTEINALRVEYENARKEFGVNITSVGAALDQRAARTKAQSELRTRLRTEAYATTSGQRGQAAIADAAINSESQLKRAQGALSARRSPGILLLQQEAGKEVILQAPKVITDQIKGALIRELTAQYPILSPIVSVFTSTLDKQMEARLKSRIDKVVSRAIEAPSSVEAALTETAKEVTDTTPIKIPPKLLAEATEKANGLRREVEGLRAMRAQIDQAVRSELDRVIAQIGHENESVREAAVGKLSRFGGRLDQRQVQKLGAMLKDGEVKWRKSIGRESHCTWYETTTPRYYAGRALEQMRSPHITSKMAQEARQAVASGKGKVRVDDPGWV